MPTEILPFTFRGDALDVVRLPDGDVGLSLRRLCEALGVDPDAQMNRLSRAAENGARWATTFVMEVVAADGKIRPMLCLPRRSVPMWAATLDASRVAPEVREKLVGYQDDAADVLAATFLPSVVAPPPAALPPGCTVEGARFHRLAADALDAGDVEGARRYMGAAYMLTRAPRQPRLSPSSRARGPSAVDIIKARIVQILSEGTIVGSRVLRARVKGNAGIEWRAVTALVEEGRVVKERAAGSLHMTYRLATGEVLQ